MIPEYNQVHASYAVATLLFDRGPKILNLKGDFREAKEGVRGTTKAGLIIAPYPGLRKGDSRPSAVVASRLISERRKTLLSLCHH